jgi:uncharacterized protein affecting Mg2+/Co2+ transport
MKKLIILIAWLAIGCSPDPEPFKYTYTVENQSGFTVTLLCPECLAVTIADGAVKTVQTNTVFSEYTIQGNDDWTIEYQETSPDAFTITAYEYELRYSISGTVHNVEVSFINDQGGITSYPNIQPGVSYRFKHFPGNQAQLTAKIISSLSGDVILYIFHKDKIIERGSGEGEGTTVTISATLE